MSKMLPKPWQIHEAIYDRVVEHRPDPLTDPKPKCYLSGPMTGLPYFNFPAFEKCAELLRQNGWFVYSPRENDSEAGIQPNPEGKLTEEVPAFKDLMKKDLWQVCDSDAVFVMPGWKESKGANIEVGLAHDLGTPVYSILSGRKIEPRVGSSTVEPLVVSQDDAGSSPAPPSILDCGPKHRFEDPVTGGAKEESLARYDLVPPDSLTELAKVYGYGEQKYPSGNDGPNYLRGYPWHLSIASMERHIQKFKAGEDIDPETGLHHLSHAAWHAFTLIAFGRRALGRDDRVKLRAA